VTNSGGPGPGVKNLFKNNIYSHFHKRNEIIQPLFTEIFHNILKIQSILRRAQGVLHKSMRELNIHNGTEFNKLIIILYFIVIKYF
jgi:hypothetical protein